MEPVAVKATYIYPNALSSKDNPNVVEIEVYLEGAKIFVANACLCKGFHRIYWILTGLTLIELKLKDELPSRVIMHEAPCWDPKTGRWTALFENKGPLEGSLGVNGFAYCFDCNPSVNLKHDPTIAVTNDPPPDHRPPYQP